VKVSLVVCSRNGVRVLSEVIAAARASLERAGDGELILVDSSSTDNTLSLMHEAARSPGVTALALTQIGQSRARNAGWAVATGDVVLFTDDDIIVPPDWVETMAAPIEAGYDATAGTVHLPDHLTESLAPRQREFLADTRSMNLGNPPRTIVGASMGFRRDLHDLGFRFEHRLDPGALGYMGDTLFHLQLT
jgi:glycosyltransferase involved in cell wall biosynthesis